MRSVVTLAVTVLEIVFVAGVIGSALVIVLTSVEDVRTMFDKNDKDRT